MTPERWQQVKHLLDRALEQPEAEREAFVRAHSQGDEELRAEVVSLLAFEEENRDFLEPRPRDPGTETTKPNLAGVRVGAYELVREIGQGGMGTVYLAVRADQEFRKRVAIKLIRGGRESHFVVSRFRNERQILARLEHPNIARLIDGGTTPDGFPYFVMEYVEGESFLSYCRAHHLSARECVKIFQPVCAAIEYAHRRNIIHRDVKPTNILVKADGTPKLLDFGIAKFVNGELEDGKDATITGWRLMTPAYASPEQLRGHSCTFRSDIYGLAAVLWEAVTGEIPTGEESVLSFDPVKAGINGDEAYRVLRLGRVAAKGLRENPDERFASVDEFAEALRASVETDTRGTATTPGVPDAPANSIAVLPFQVLGNDTSSETYLGAALADAVIIRLSKVGRIVVRPTSSVMRFPPTTEATIVGRALKVRHVLEGRVQKIDTRMRVTVQLICMDSGAPIWAATFDETSGDLLRLEDSISAQVAQALLPHLTGEERRELEQHGTNSPKAHRAYLQGRWHWSRHTEEALPHALMHFSEAVVEDPRYARAHAGIADYHIALGIRGVMHPAESFSAAIESARQAIALEPRLAEAHASLGLALWARDGDYEAAEQHLQTALTLNPDYAAARDWFGLASLARGKLELAMLSVERARALEPASAIFASDLAMCYYSMRRYSEAIECFAGEQSPPPVVSGSMLALALLASGDSTRGLEAARRYSAAMERAPLSLGVLAVAESACGKQRAAEEILAELRTRSRDYYVSGIAMALGELACGRAKEAIRQLRRASEERDWWTRYLRYMPVWDPLRSQPAFARLVREGEVRSKPSAWRRYGMAAAAVVVALAGAAAYRYFPGAPAPLEGAAISRITTNGVADSTAISPDGQYLAWVSRRGGTATVWARKQDGSAARQIAGPFEGNLLSLVFTRGHEHLAFVVQPVNNPAGTALHIVPVDGGAERPVIAGVPGSARLAADESRIAFYRPSGDNDELVVADVNPGAGKKGSEKVVYSLRHPDVFAERPAPAWSTDGRSLACVIRAAAQPMQGIHPMTVTLDGAPRMAGTEAWEKISDIAWTARGLMVAGQASRTGFQQIWFVPDGGGKAARVTNDLDDYSSLSVTADAGAVAAVQAQTVTNVFTLESATASPHQVTPGGGRYFDVAWAPGGGIVYASDATGSSEIWMMDASGNGQRQLTRGPGRSHAPAVSPDGRTIAFHSNRNGVWNIWTVDFGGGEPARLSRDSSESTWPQFTPDSAAVVYQHLGINALYSVRKQALAGGPVQPLTTAHTMYPTVAADGRIAYWYCQDPSSPRWSIAVLEPGTQAPERFISFPPDRMPHELLRWVPGRNAISYVENRQGVSNVWIQPLDGAPARRFTGFTSGHIYSFDWSRDGRLVYSQGSTTSNVVLLKGQRQ